MSLGLYHTTFCPHNRSRGCPSPASLMSSLPPFPHVVEAITAYPSRLNPPPPSLVLAAIRSQSFLKSLELECVSSLPQNFFPFHEQKI